MILRATRAPGNASRIFQCALGLKLPPPGLQALDLALLVTKIYKQVKQKKARSEVGCSVVLEVVGFALENGRNPFVEASA